MNSEDTEQRSFSGWIARPETLIGLSAVLLSLCGLFIAIYEASLIRQAQRASVWPHVEVAVSINQGSIRLWAENTGVGPARVQAAAVTYEGERVANWSDMLRSVTGSERIGSDYYRSLINGRVLPSGSPETIFSITEDQGPQAEVVIEQLQRAVLDGTVDVIVCYCSVYDECWTASLQEMISRLQADAVPTGAQEVNTCNAMERSGI